MNTTDLINQLKAKYPIVYKQEIPWGDMDAFQHVNNVNYYRYAESARIAYMNHLNIMNDKTHIVIYTSSCKYFSPVTYPDTLWIGTRIEEMRNSSFKMTYDMYSQEQQTLVAQADAVIVTIDSESTQKIAIPDAIRSKMIIMEAGSGNTIQQL